MKQVRNYVICPKDEKIVAQKCKFPTATQVVGS